MMKRIVRSFVVLLCPALLAACPSAEGLQGLRILKTELKTAGYDLVYPLTTGYNIGLLFQIRETTDGTMFRKTLCTVTYDNSEGVKENLLLSTYESDKTSNFEILAGLSETLLKGKAEANATLKNNDVSKVSLTLSNVVGLLANNFRQSGCRMVRAGRSIQSVSSTSSQQSMPKGVSRARLS